MSSPAGAHRCSRYVICSPDYSGAGMSVAGNVASCMAVTWLVRTDGFFATSRDTTSLDPADQSSNSVLRTSFSNGDPLRSSDFFVVACPSWNLHC
jgi:hypothetical protein